MSDAGWPTLDKRLDDADADGRTRAGALSSSCGNFADCEPEDGPQHALGAPRLLDAFESRNVDVALANLAKRLHAADWCSSSRTVGCFRSLRGALVD